MIKINTNIRALCEEAFFTISTDLDTEQAEKVALLVVESNLKCTKDALTDRLEGNYKLISSIIKGSEFNAGSIAVLDIMNKTLSKQISEIDNKLHELNILTVQFKVAKIFE